ncbi:MAG: hypothetical protein WBX19_14110 [Terracidiphilus sp.]
MTIHDAINLKKSRQSHRHREIRRERLLLADKVESMPDRILRANGCEETIQTIGAETSAASARIEAIDEELRTPWTPPSGRDLAALIQLVQRVEQLSRESSEQSNAAMVAEHAEQFKKAAERRKREEEIDRVLLPKAGKEARAMFDKVGLDASPFIGTRLGKG